MWRIIKHNFYFHLLQTKEDIKNAKAKRLHLKEKILKQSSDSEVALSRFLSKLWNDNGDDWATVYEVNLATEKYAAKENAIDLTCAEMLDIETAFYSAISFAFLDVDPGKFLA